MSERGPWQGMMTIARFNWPFYAVSVAILIAALAGLFLLSGLALKLLCGMALTGSAYFLFGSLGVSHFIYDRSDLYRWGWVDRAMRGANLRLAILCHSGFDEASAQLRERFADVQWQLLDHFDERQMTEASIRRARAKFPPTPGTLASPYGAWPLVAFSVLDHPALLSVVCLSLESVARQEDGNHCTCLFHHRLGFVVPVVRRLRCLADGLVLLIDVLLPQGFVAKIAQCQASDRKPRFRSTIPMAEIRSSPAR